MYWIPEYLHEKFGNKTSPFVSIWFCQMQTRNNDVLKWITDHHVSKKKLHIRIA